MNTRSTFQILRIALGLVLLSSLELGEITPASAQVLRCYVKANATGSNTGASWQNAFNDLQSALGASPCAEVWVAEGTYKPTGPTGGTDRTASFQLKSGVALYGGFAGTETLLTQRNPKTNPTILSGDIGETAVPTDNSYHVVVGSGTDTTALLDGFTITAGNASSTVSPDDCGGGMLNWSGSPSLANVTFSANSATYGGGMENYYYSNPSLVNVTFSANSATGGGGMGNIYSSPDLVNVTFNGNLAAWEGGGMYSTYQYGSGPSLRNVTFSGNSASSGGAMSNQGTSATITNSILYGDTGGEIIESSGATTVTYSIVQGGHTGTGNLDANPRLGPLADNGGFTETMLLGIGSPAIDRGTNTGCPAADQRGRARPQDGDGNGSALCDMGATELPRLLTKTFPSLGAQDGVIQESSENSGIGGAVDAANITFAMGDDALDRQGRSILSFNTAALPDNAVIASVTLRIRRAGLVGTNPFTTHGNILVDVRKGPFSNNAALQPADFQAPASKQAAMTIPKRLVNGWYSGVMPLINLVYVNKVGLTQFRLRFAMDDNDDMHADYLKFFSGNYAIAADRPALIVKYYSP